MGGSSSTPILTGLPNINIGGGLATTFPSNNNPVIGNVNIGTGGSSSSSSSSNNGGTFGAIISLISQGLGGWTRNPTSQIVVNGGQVSALPTFQAQANMSVPQYQTYSPPLGSTAVGTPAASAGGAVGSGIDGILQWAMANPLFVFLGIGGMFLLFREPPRRR